MQLKPNRFAGLVMILGSAAFSAQVPLMAKTAKKPVPAIVQQGAAETQASTSAQGSATTPDEPAAAQTGAQASGDQAGAATTTTTTQATGQTSGQTESADVKAATSADVKAGAAVYDRNGGQVGKVESVSAKGAVVNTGTARAVIPISSFARNDKGLVMSMSKAELDAAAKKKGGK